MTEPLFTLPPLPTGWEGVPRMAFTTKPPPNLDARDRHDIAFGIRTAEQLLEAFKNRERRIIKAMRK